MFDINDLYEEGYHNKLFQYAEKVDTPCLLVDLDIVSNKYQELTKHFPFANIYYAVKANPHVQVLSLLRDLGSNFDVASIYELDKLLSLGISPDRMSYGNTIKKKKDIAYFYEKGVRLFVTDSIADLKNIAEFAPGSKVFVRILVEGSETADWPLSRKFGCHPDMAINLIEVANKLKLKPFGISFHVGSQQKDIGTWDGALATVRYIFNWVKEELDIKLEMINLGGGFPAQYISKVNALETYASEIKRFIAEDFADDFPKIFLEPGRSLVGDAGMLVSEVVLISQKSSTALNRWVYIDIGKFSGLIETLDESIKYPIYTSKSGPKEEVIIAGPTCDSMDIMYNDYRYELPLNLEIGDRLYWLSTGAYTSSYSAIEFNGFPPLKTICI
ncbi:MAG: type III PLP-dependent enzyme [Candidatus Delongbacteria bacterium]|nr:type III PLP-dependent enzyme [Candidatus Delongbacteria bacterium]MBN2836511.1 type III PLP-dependent enzyme [Candidatus Delongbacteria bacterium]